MRLKALAVLGGTLALLCATAPEANAQSGCKFGCVCSEIGCGCGTSDIGNGSSCEATATSCRVYRCGVRTPELGFAADGSVVEMGRVAPQLADALGFQVENTEDGPGQAAPLGAPNAWEYLEPGHAVSRRCDGVIVAHAWEPLAAAAVRERSRVISL
jgi:hypothetical protein